MTDPTSRQQPTPTNPVSKRRLLGARLGTDLYTRLKHRSTKTGLPYPAILAAAYTHHHQTLTTPADTPADAFVYQPPTRLGAGSHLVQFNLTEHQISLLRDLANRTHLSLAGTIRALLDRYLKPTPLLWLPPDEQ